MVVILGAGQSGNGIEHYYPKEILQARFGDFDELEINGDQVGANGMLIKKAELSEYVVARLTAESTCSEELENKLLGSLNKLIY